MRAVYRAHLPADAPPSARSALAGAVGSDDPAVTAAARAAFDTALTRGLLVGAVAALTGAAVGWWTLRAPTAPTGSATAPTGVPPSLEAARP